jgi:hypothetical protein
MAARFTAARQAATDPAFISTPFGRGKEDPRTTRPLNCLFLVIIAGYAPFR